MCSLPLSKKGKQLTFTSISDNQFLIEGYSDKVKIGGESEYSISYVDFYNGPLVHIGHDFLGRGKITNIDLVDTSTIDYIIVKITLDTNNE